MIQKPTLEEIQNKIQYRLVEKLVASEKHYRLLVENLREIVFTIDEEGKLIFLNLAWSETLGYSVEHSLRLPLNSFLTVDSRTKGEKLLQAVLQDKKTLRQELCFQHQNGESVWLEISVASHNQNQASGTLININNHQKAIAQLKYTAYHDSLTGLYNRAAFIEFLQNEIDKINRHSEQIFAVLLLDLDGFKSVNDSFGHLVGDRLLIEVSHRLQKCLNSWDIMARLGGDEFVILLPNLRNTDNATRIAKIIVKALGPVFNLDNNEVFISTSIGIVLSTSGFKKPEDFLRNADIALYEAKAQGKGIDKTFDNQMHAKTIARISLETSLRKALKNQELEVHYQPIISLENYRIIGFEALVRWFHPTKGLISPGVFIPIAEETGLIIDLGWWVFQQACQQMVIWQKNFPQSKLQFMSINLSVRQFTHPDLLDKINEILFLTGLKRKFLKLEITESIIIDNSEANNIKLQQLRASGIKLAIDDFGTGYSSLNYLHRFALDTLKIDKSFIKQIHIPGKHQAIVETIIVLAHNLGMDVIAEGVETKEQLEQLEKIGFFGCEQVQGYYFSHPKPASELEKMLTNYLYSIY